jgi:hypothetical protein
MPKIDERQFKVVIVLWLLRYRQHDTSARSGVMRGYHVIHTPFCRSEKRIEVDTWKGENDQEDLPCIQIECRYTCVWSMLLRG